MERDSTVYEQDKQILELGKALARQPGPEVAGQLVAYHGGIKEKSRQMKAMAGELNMHQAQVSVGHSCVTNFGLVQYYPHLSPFILPSSIFLLSILTHSRSVSINMKSNG